MSTRLFFFFLFMLPGLAQAATYYVSKVPGASNGNPCTSPGAQACATIAGAGAKMTQAGDVMIIQAGTYNERMLTGFPWRNGSSDGVRTVYKAETPGTVILHPTSGRGAVINLGAGRQFIDLEGLVVDATTNGLGWPPIMDNSGSPATNVAGVKFDGGTNALRLINSDVFGSQDVPSGNCVIATDRGTNHQLLNNRIHHCVEYGIYWVVVGGTIDGNTIYDNGGYGLHHYDDNGGVNNNTIRNNVFRGNGFRSFNINREPMVTPAVILASGSNPLFYNNIIHGNYAGVQLWASGPQVYNNAFYGNLSATANDYHTGCVLVQNSGAAATVGNNLCFNNVQNSVFHLSGPTPSTFANRTTDPAWRAPASGDFHLLQGSPAIGQAVSLAGIFSLDAEGQSRGAVWDQGPLEFVAAVPPPNPPPPGKQLELIGNGNALDTSGNGRHATLVGGALTNGQPIVGTETSFVLDGVNDHLTVAENIAFRPANLLCASAWLNSTNANYAYVWDQALIHGLWIDPLGDLHGYVMSGGNLIPVASSGASVLSGQNTHVVFTKTTTGLQLYINGVPRGFTATTAALDTGPTSTVYIGRNGQLSQEFYAGRLARVTFFNDQCDQAAVNSLFNVQTPAGSLAGTRWRFYQANAAENTPIAGSGENDPDVPIAIASKVRQRWTIANSSGATVNRFYGLECNVNGGSFSTLTNSCATAPACIADDTQAAMGDATTNLLNLAGLSYTPGRRVVDTINQGLTTSLVNGAATEWDWTLAFRQTLADQDVVRCRPQGLTTYPAALPTITLEAPIATPTWVRQGGTATGGKHQ